MLKYYCNIPELEKEYEVEVTEEDGTIKVVIDGKEHNIDFYENGENFYSIIIDNASFQVDIAENNGKYEIISNGDLYTVEVLDEMKKIIKERSVAGLRGRQVIEAQMPGVIQKVFVEEGDEVEAGAPLLVLVAMKMENEITTPKAGTVKEVFVGEGETVSDGDKLIVVE